MAGRNAATANRFHVAAQSYSRGFTLIETLVVIAIIAIMLSVLLPALHSARGQMRSLQCSSNMRTIAFQFSLFAEGDVSEGRGTSEHLSGGRFYINDFQAWMYKVDHFWDIEDSATGTLDPGKEPMLCPAVPALLTKRAGFPCGAGSISPSEEVSIAMNMRFYRAVVVFNDQPILLPPASSHLRADILQHPYAPLAMDVDGREAARRNISPFYTAPPLPDEVGPYSSGHYWVPAKRHKGRMNVVFVGGHVLSSPNPQQETWDWALQARAGNQ